MIPEDKIISPLYKRFIAYLIDISMHYSVTITCGRLLFEFNWVEISLINFFILCVYFLYFYNTPTSQTIGQKIFMIKLEYYGPKRLKQLFIIPRAMMLASIANPILILIIPALMILFSLLLLIQKQIREKKQFLWDIVGHTIVIESS